MTGMQRAHSDRNIAIKEMYRRGMTLEAIGGVFGITRERVRQVVNWYFGLEREDGGQAIQSLLKARDRSEKLAKEAEVRLQKQIAKWGMTKAEIAAVSDLPRSDHRHPVRRFECQRKNAKVRGISWQLSFKQWWDIWQQSGHWEQRGRGQGYVMARYGDSDGYSVDNVYICTGAQNSKDSYITKPAAGRVEKRRKTLEARA